MYRPKEGNEWVLNGTKCWITHGASSDVVVVAIVRTGDLLDSNGMTTFVDRNGVRIGIKAGKKENKLGMRPSETRRSHISRTAGYLKTTSSAGR